MRTAVVKMHTSYSFNLFCADLAFHLLKFPGQLLLPKVKLPGNICSDAKAACVHRCVHRQVYLRVHVHIEHSWSTRRVHARTWSHVV